jgi:hypothetical protein
MSFGGPRVSFTNIFLGFASKKYYQTDSRAPKCLPRVTKTVMYIANINLVNTNNFRLRVSSLDAKKAAEFLIAAKSVV